MNTEVLKSDHPVAIQHAVDILRNGGLVAFPTDTVYGLAALPAKSEFIERLFTVKGREATRAIAILISASEQLEEISLSPNSTAKKLANKFWPGPITLIVPRHPGLPEILSPNMTIGVRVPDHEVALQLLSMTGPLGVTSANISGEDNTTTADEVLKQLDGRIHLIIDGGKTPGNIPSTVVDCTSLEPEILRSGPISLFDIQQAIHD